MLVQSLTGSFAGVARPRARGRPIDGRGLIIMATVIGLRLNVLPAVRYTKIRAYTGEKKIVSFDYEKRLEIYKQRPLIGHVISLKEGTT